MTKKIMTVIGARPQFIKAAPVSKRLLSSSHFTETIVHTGQHFDENMSDVFFRDLNLPIPDYNLGISGLSHGAMTGQMLEKVEECIIQERPDFLLVYGDTNSTLAGALAAAKLDIPVVHVEAGLRSGNMQMPEEINRILVDRLSALLFCPTDVAVENLAKEGFPFPVPGSQKQIITNVGDVMIDALADVRERALHEVDLGDYGITDDGYILCTIHRQENTNDVNRLRNIFSAIKKISRSFRVVFPVHPRTRKTLQELGFSKNIDNVIFLDPLPYLAMQKFTMNARVIFTDSGGVQKEAYFHQVPCVTVRDETEWTETVASGWNQLVEANVEEIVSAVNNAERPSAHQGLLYGAADASEKIIKILGEF